MLAEARAEGARFGFEAEDYLRVAADAVPTYQAWGAVALDLQPGNATRYPMLLTDLDYRRGGTEHYPLHLVEGGGWGGNLLISMPDDRRGSCFVIGLPAFLWADYVEDKTGRRWADAVHIAAFVNAFSIIIEEDR